MSQFASGKAASPSLCERYADEIALLDDPEPETPERGAARAHLAGCERCQRERSDMRALSTALSARVKSLMAQAPAFSEAAIAKQAARRGSAGDSRWRDVARTEAGDARRGPASISPPGGHLTPTRALAPASTWRSRLSAVGSVAVVALITALLAMTLTGHLLGQPGRGNHSQVTAHAAVPLSALTIFSPGYSTPTNGALEPIAYRASDGALLWTHTLDAQPDGPPVIVQGVVYLVAGQTALALRASAGTSL